MVKLNLRGGGSGVRGIGNVVTNHSGNVITRIRSGDVASHNGSHNNVLSGINADVIDDVLSDNIIILDALNQNNDSFHCIDASCNDIDDHSTRITDSFNGNVGSFNTGTTVFDIDRPRRLVFTRERVSDLEGKALPKTGMLGGSLMLAASAMLGIVAGVFMDYAGWRRKHGMEPYFESLGWQLAGWSPYRSLELLPFEPMGYGPSTWPFQIRDQLLRLQAANLSFVGRVAKAARGLGASVIEMREIWSASFHRAINGPWTLQP